MTIRTQKARTAARLALMTALATGVAPAALAQPAASLDRHSAPVLATDGIGTGSAETTGHLRFGFNVQADYANDPAVWEIRRNPGPDDTENNRVVESQLRGHFNFSLTLADRAVVFVGVPIDFVLDGMNGSVHAAVPRASGFNLGDPFVGARLRLFGSTDDVFMMAVQGSVAFPLAQAIERPTWSGDRTVSGKIHVLPQFNLGMLRLVLDVGALIRPQQQYPDAALESELFYGLSATIRPEGVPLAILAEARSAIAFRRPGDREETPLELLAGVRYQSDDNGLVAGASAGVGLTNALGTPEWRAIASIGWLRPTDRDSDDDGIADSRDECVDEPEDLDGVQDEDGCPEDDDGDGIADAVDECRSEPEDRDGFEDENGCPDPDNDGDGILDADDRCPAEAEDVDSFEDADGCPDTDNDQDGVLDANDGAPNDPEDRDGFEDEDGVPEPDNDHDTILDAADRCPNEAGPAENQGCPDTDRDGDTVLDRFDNCPDEAGTVENHGCRTAQLVTITADRIEISTTIYFATGRATIQRRSFGLLDNVAAVLSSHPEIQRVRIEGHTDSRGNVDANMQLSQLRADSVLQYLVEHGVDATRVRAIGYGPSRPVVPNARRTADHNRNRRVEFVIERD